MGRDRFTHTEWGTRAGYKIFGYCDHGFQLSCREEKEVYEELKAEGWTVHKHGWPDFMATRGEEIRLIEVKSGSDSIQTSQLIVGAGLAKLGAKVETFIRENPNRQRRIHWKPKPLQKRGTDQCVD